MYKNGIKVDIASYMMEKKSQILLITMCGQPNKVFQ